MNPYAVIGSGMGTTEAVSLGVRLKAWHDAMVAHERRQRSAPSKESCHDECPHAEARALWAEAVETFGPRAYELTLLHSRGKKIHRASRPGTSTEGTAAVVDYATSPDGGVRL